MVQDPDFAEFQSRGVDCLFTHAEGDIDIALYDAAAGSYVTGSGGVVDNEQIDFEGLVAGTYYIQVFFGNAGNAYDLIWDQFPAPDDNYEENDTLATAYDLSSSETIWLSNLQGLGRQADQDWYKIEVTSGFTEVRVRCDFTHSEGDIDIQLTNAAGAVVASSTGVANSESIVFNVVTAGTYYINVYFGNGNNTYDLWWDDIVVGSATPNIAYVGHTINDDAIESSGDGDGKVDPGETIELRVDLKNFGAQDATNVTATLSTTNPNVTGISDNFENVPNMQVGRTVGTVSDFDFTTSSATPAGPIVFNLLINSDQGSWNTSVTVQVTNGDDNYEENDTLAAAYDLSNSEQTFLSSINFAGNQFDQDWYKIDVSPGLNRVIVDCTFTHAAGDIDISLHNAAGTELAFSDGIVNNENIDFNVPTAGTYYIRVHFGNQGNSYDLWWDDVVPVVPEITVTGGPLLNVGISDGDPTPDTADGTDFGSVSTEAGSVSRTFLIANEGVANLNIGTISVNSPAFEVVPGYPTLLTPGASGTVTVRFDPSSVGPFQAIVTIPNNDLDEAVFDFAIVGTGYTITLPVALETPSQPWTSSGNASWFGQNATTHDGIDAAESGNIADSQVSSMETTVVGPVTVSFWWKVSSETNWDYLRFYVNNVQQPGAIEISGDVDWQQITVPVTGVGIHTLRWTYSKDGSVSSLADAGWVDQVTVTPLTGFGLWAALNIPFGQDASFDGISPTTGVPNGVAYVFGPTPPAPIGGNPGGTGKIAAPPSIPADVNVYLELSAAGVGGVVMALEGWVPIVSWVNGQPPVFAYPSFTSIVGGFVIDNANPSPFFYRYRVVQR